MAKTYRLLFSLLLVACEAPAPKSEAPAVAFSPEAIDLEGLTRFTNDGSQVGELVYVPIYSSVHHQGGTSRYPLTAVLSVHNVGLSERIELTSVTYFDTSGRRLKELVEAETVLGPLATKQFVIPARDQSGGTGANFVVKWEAEGPTPRPVIEALMISTSSSQGISFTTQGSVIQKLERDSTTATTAD